MNDISLTLKFSNIGAAIAALTALQGIPGVAHQMSHIAHDDRPDVGAPEAPLPPIVPPPAPAAPPTVDTAAIFGGQQVPSPAPATPVPPVPPATLNAAAAAGYGPFDKDGLPWDARIHSETKSMNKDGSWRQRRNMPEGYKETIEAELKAALAAAPAGVASSPAGTAAPVAAPIAPPAPPAPPVAPPAPIPPAPPVAPPQAPAGGESFAEFVTRTAPLFTADPEGATAKMGQALNSAGLTALGQLAARPDLLPSVAAVFDALTKPAVPA